MIGRLIRSPYPVAALLVLGAAERVLWNLLRPGSGATGEAMSVALAIGEGRGFADAFRTGQGPTAHLLPVSPGIAGGVYGLFGVRSPVAEAVLATWSIGLALGTYLVLFRAFSQLGAPRWARLLSLAYACLAPAYAAQEAIEFRVWEGGLAVFIGAVFLDRLLAADLDAAPHSAEMGGRAITLGLIAAVLFFVNPPLGVAAAAALVVFGLRRLTVRQNVVAASCSAALLAAMVAPWAMRNQAVFGEPIPLRSNAGLELAVGNYPGATDFAHERDRFQARMEAIHPTLSDPAFARVEAVGEVAYARAMGAEATAWMRAHPGETARLMLHHVRETFVPSGWKFDVHAASVRAKAKILTAQLAGVAGLIGMGVLLARRTRGAVYPAIMMAAVALVFSPFQPVARYSYLLYPLLVYLAGCAAFPLVGRRAG